MNAHQRRVRRRLNARNRIYPGVTVKEVDQSTVVQGQPVSLALCMTPPPRPLLQVDELKHELTLCFRSVLLINDNRIDDFVRRQLLNVVDRLFETRVPLVVRHQATCDATNNPPSVVDENGLVLHVEAWNGASQLIGAWAFTKTPIGVQVEDLYSRW